MSETKKRSLSFFFLWFFVVSISIYAAILLGFVWSKVYIKNESLYGDGPFFNSIVYVLILIGLFAGYGQRIVLDTKLKKTHDWISRYWFPATFIGFPVGCFVSLFIFFFAGDRLFKIGSTLLPHVDFGTVAIFAMLLLVGMITGVFQWLSLKWELRGCHKWSLVSGLSLTIGGLPLVILPIDYMIVSVFISIALGTAISGFFVESLIVNEAK